MNKNIFFLTIIATILSSQLNASAPSTSKSDFEKLFPSGQENPQSNDRDVYQDSEQHFNEKEFDALYEQACVTPAPEENHSPTVRETATAPLQTHIPQRSSDKATTQNLVTVSRPSSPNPDIKAIKLLYIQAAIARRLIKKQRGQELKFSAYTAFTPEAYTQIALAQNAQKKYGNEQENIADKIIRRGSHKVQLRLYIKPHDGHEKPFNVLATKPLRDLSGIIELLDKTQTNMQAASFIHFHDKQQTLTCLSQKDLSVILSKPKEDDTLMLKISLTSLDKKIHTKTKLFTSLINIAELPHVLYRNNLARNNSELYNVIDLLRRIGENKGLYNVANCNELKIKVHPPIRQPQAPLHTQSKK